MDDADLRVLSVLTTWLGVHHAHLNADRLIRVIAEHESPRVHAYWAAIASWLAKDCAFRPADSRRRSSARIEDSGSGARCSNAR